MAKYRVWRLSLAGLFALLLMGGLAAGALADDTKSFDLVFTGGKLSGTENVLRVEEGDHVEIGIRSDESIGLHLHGYDIEVHVSPSGDMRMTFEAHATGRFPVMLHGEHGHGHALFYVEVHPR